jgi:predicted NBD/HSP70 family sugar kinase
MANDADLAALGEANFGAGRGASTVLSLCVRDGIGAGIVLGGALHTGRNGMSGELAHVQVVEDGPYCPCGNRGCLATQTTNPLVVDALTSRYGRPLTFDDIELLIERGDPVAVRFFRDLGALVGRPMSTLVTTLDPDVVVVDACLGTAAQPFIAGLRAEIGLRCPPLPASVDVVVGDLRDAVALGGVALTENS